MIIDATCDSISITREDWAVKESSFRKFLASVNINTWSCFEEWLKENFDGRLERYQLSKLIIFPTKEIKMYFIMKYF